MLEKIKNEAMKKIVLISVGAAVLYGILSYIIRRIENIAFIENSPTSTLIDIVFSPIATSLAAVINFALLFTLVYVILKLTKADITAHKLLKLVLVYSLIPSTIGIIASLVSILSYVITGLTSTILDHIIQTKQTQKYTRNKQK